MLTISGWIYAQPPADSMIEGYRLVEVASVADAMEQLYGQRAHMSHDMRPVFKTKFAGRAVTVLLKKRSTRTGRKLPRECWMRLTPPVPARST